MDRREPSQDKQDELELELEYFERVGLTARLGLLRVAGTWAGRGAAEVDAPGLIVDDGLRDRRFKPIAEPLEPEAATWRAAYAVPVELTALPEVTYALDAGPIVDLPNPTDRTLAQTPPAPEPPPPPAAPFVPIPAATNGNGRHLEVGDLDTEPLPPTRPIGRNGHVPPVVRLSPEPIRPDEEAALAELAQLAEGNRRRRWRGPALALAALVFVVGAGLLAVAVGSSDSAKTRSRPTSSPVPSASTRAPRSPSPPIALAALPGAPAGAGATLRPLGHGRVELRVHNLPPGRYEAWLYRSLIDARPLGTFHGPAGRLALRPGPQATRYPFLDISHEDDANPAHSGRSVLRVPLAAVRRAAAAGPGR